MLPLGVLYDILSICFPGLSSKALVVKCLTKPRCTNKYGHLLGVCKVGGYGKGLGCIFRRVSSICQA
uniref:Uncharacterized protein n=1 Tax=Arundo donax TaxID=35708 RepID=A0A0A9AEJ9_ARUDO